MFHQHIKPNFLSLSHEVPKYEIKLKKWKKHQIFQTFLFQIYITLDKQYHYKKKLVRSYAQRPAKSDKTFNVRVNSNRKKLSSTNRRGVIWAKVTPLSEVTPFYGT